MIWHSPGSTHGLVHRQSTQGPTIDPDFADNWSESSNSSNHYEQTSFIDEELSTSQVLCNTLMNIQKLYTLAYLRGEGEEGEEGDKGNLLTSSAGPSHHHSQGLADHPYDEIDGPTSSSPVEETSVAIWKIP